MILERMQTESVKQLTAAEREKLAEEIRGFLVAHVSQTGGHLAPNLGVVELTIALHCVFDPYVDRLVFDVGHQAYTHKILTGRAAEFTTLRQLGGLSGFPKTAESAADAFNTGHSSTSISAALGFAEAARLKGESYYSVAVIGDGAMTGGMAFEAMNQAGSSKTPLIVVLNDNGMSISKNVGGLAKALKRIRNTDQYFRFKAEVKSALDRIPVIGKPLKVRLSTLKKKLKQFLIPNVIFEDLGFTYLGPVDGHDISALITVLKHAKRLKEPVIIHTHTKKGKGYPPAERNPDLFHGISSFNPSVGLANGQDGVPTWSEHFGKTLCRMAKTDGNLVAITAAMPLSTGLQDFASAFPQRFFDVGIAEQNAVTFAAGLAQAGLTPVFAVYATFLQRAYDQILHDVALQKLHVVFCIDRCGPVGEDGETHQGVYDIAFLSHIPGMTILSPSNAADFDEMLEYAVHQMKGPVAVRYPRGEIRSLDAPPPHVALPGGRVLQEGNDVLLISVGIMCAEALRAAELLRQQHIQATVIDARAVKPMDLALFRQYAAQAEVVATVEDVVMTGGFGEQLAAALGREVIRFAFPDEPIQQGKVSELFQIYGLQGDRIARAIQKALEL